MSKTTVIYHSADYDGIFCREIAKKFLPGAELIGWDYGQPTVAFPAEGTVYVMDLSPDCFTLQPPCSTEEDRVACWSRLIWIDHHKSAITKYPASICGYRIDGVSACRLAWQWFVSDHTDFVVQCMGLPGKQAFIDRIVAEPLAVRLAGEYDVWDHKGDGDIEFQFGLDSEEYLDWNKLLSGCPDYAKILIANGRSAMQCYKKRDADIMLGRSFLLDWEGLKFLCLNTARCNSNTFAVRDIPSTGHDALIGFFYNGDGWTVSLYHANHRKDLDLSQIACKYDGGGHRGACGFRTKIFPFLSGLTCV